MRQKRRVPLTLTKTLKGEIYETLSQVNANNHIFTERRIDRGAGSAGI
jgi:hypothetical protein